jgi:hypothetical protein
MLKLFHPVTTLGKRGVLVKSLRAAVLIKNEDEDDDDDDDDDDSRLPLCRPPPSWNYGATSPPSRSFRRRWNFHLRQGFGGQDGGTSRRDKSAFAQLRRDKQGDLNRFDDAPK